MHRLHRATARPHWRRWRYGRVMRSRGERSGDLTSPASRGQIAVMATKDQLREWQKEGEAVRRARDDRKDRGERSADEVKALREDAARTACR